MMLWTVRRITVYRIWADLSVDCLQAKKETAFAVSFFVPEWVPCQGPPLVALVFAQQNRRTKRIAAPKEKRHPFGCLFSFVTAHMFCCLHSRPPQGRGSVRGEPLTGSPTRVQSPARRRPLLRSKSAAPKKKDTHVGVFLFCDCPQVLLSVNQRFLSCFSGDVAAPSSSSVTI